MSLPTRAAADLVNRAVPLVLQRSSAVDRGGAARIRLYERGLVVRCGQGGGGQGPRAVWWWRATLKSLSPLQRRGPCEMGGSLRRRISKESRQAARGKRAPAGAKGWLRVSMCQIASVSLRERSIWATFGTRCLPRRLLVRW